MDSKYDTSTNTTPKIYFKNTISKHFGKNYWHDFKITNINQVARNIICGHIVYLSVGDF